MTRTYALRRLLEHGPLTVREVQEITGWERRHVDNTLRALRKCKCIRRAGKRRIQSKTALAYALVISC